MQVPLKCQAEVVVVVAAVKAACKSLQVAVRVVAECTACPAA